MAHSTQPTHMSRVTQEILERFRTQSEAFISADEAGARRFYRSQHPTEIAVLKCMDGRLDFAVMTKTPPGILSPFRSMGGKFSMGSPWFGDLVDELVGHSWRENGAGTIVLVTYHFSRSHNSHLGCKGWGYDKEGAAVAAHQLSQHIGDIYGRGHNGMRAVVVGVDTDEDALVFHGQGTLDLGLISEMTEQDLFTQFRSLYPDMGKEMMTDLFQLVKGNREHVRDVRTSKRALVDMDHRENIISVGRGFDSLHMPNRMLIIGPYDDGWPDEVGVAGNIIKSNLEAGRINPEDGLLLLCCSAYRSNRGTGFEHKRSEFRARDMAKFSLEALARKVPELKFDLIIGKVDMDTRELHVLERS